MVQFFQDLPGVLPAHAGMILDKTATDGLIDSAPRACGDDPATAGSSTSGSSVLPAHAGMIPARRART